VSVPSHQFESEIAKLKKQEAIYVEAMDTLQKDLEALEQENAQLKKLSRRVGDKGAAGPGLTAAALQGLRKATPTGTGSGAATPGSRDAESPIESSVEVDSAALNGLRQVRRRAGGSPKLNCGDAVDTTAPLRYAARKVVRRCSICAARTLGSRAAWRWCRPRRCRRCRVNCRPTRACPPLPSCGPRAASCCTVPCQGDDAWRLYVSCLMPFVCNPLR